MILSNEPGYYKPGQYGMRIENLILVVEQTIPGGECSMLGFETLTLVPFDRSLIDVRSLTSHEIRWIDDYHSQVFRVIGPMLDGEERQWLKQITGPLCGDRPGQYAG